MTRFVAALPYDVVEVGRATVVATISRSPGIDGQGKPYHAALPGAIRLENPDRQVARAAEKQLFADLDLRLEDIRFAWVSGAADVAFVDGNDDVRPDKDGYRFIKNVDGLCGPTNTVKACWLGDCGMMVVNGTDKTGRYFDGFLHVTRLNLNGDDQFIDGNGQAAGGVELMLKKLVAHYEPKQLQLTLVAGIAPAFYIHNFQPTAEELAKEPDLTAEEKKQRGFKGWKERGWLRPLPGKSGWYEADLYAALRHQVERAGLLDVYDESHVALDGNPASGHASHRAARLGKVEETRDLYLLIPDGYRTLS